MFPLSCDLLTKMLSVGYLQMPIICVLYKDLKKEFSNVLKIF